METLNTEQMMKVWIRELDTLRKEALGLAQMLEQIKAAAIAEVQEISAPPATEMLPAALRDAIRAEIQGALYRPIKKVPKMWADDTKRQILHSYEMARKLSKSDPKHRGAVKKLLGHYGITSAHLAQWRYQLKAKVQPRVS